MVWIRGFLIIIVGAMPATFLLWFALIPFAAAVSVFGEHALSASVTIVWFLLAAIGTIALWLAPFQSTGPKLLSGLLAGALAICPFAFLLIRDLVEGGSDAGSVMGFLIAGPAAVAIILMFSFFRRLLDIQRSVTTENYNV
jgi:hypothetical protein